MAVISHNIKLQNASYEIINSIYNRYKRVHWNNKKSIFNPIIHIKSSGDTILEDESLDGYEDSLLFTIHVFDLNNDTMMTLYNRDEIDFVNSKELDIKFIRVFKDGSTLLRLSGEYIFGYEQTVTITCK